MRKGIVSDGRLAGLILFWTFLVSVLRALRLPNDFAEAHWLLDYRFGFIKRGLVGSLYTLGCRAFGGSPTPASIAVLSAILYAAECAALCFILWRILRRQSFGYAGVLVALVFVSSPFVVMSAHLFGYFDGLLYVLAIAAIALILRGRPLAAAPLQIAALLVHESYLFVGFPLAVAASALTCATPERRGAWRGHAATHALALLAAAAVIVHQSALVDPLALRGQLSAYLKTFDFIASRSEWIAVWQTTSFPDFFHRQAGLFAKRCLDPVVALPVLPPLLALLSVAWVVFRTAVPPRLLALLAGATLCPLAMHAMAWDTARISCYPLGGALIAVWMLCELRAPSAAVPRVWGALLALLALGVNIRVGIPLMDFRTELFPESLRMLLYAPALAFTAALAIRQAVVERSPVEDAACLEEAG
jgi:hypothetical protein